MSNTDGRPGTTPLGRIDIALVFAFWTVFAVLTTANRVWDPRPFAPGPAAASPTLAVALMVSLTEAYLWAAATLLVFWLAGRYPIEAPDRLSRLALLAVTGVVVVVVIGFIVSAVQRGFLDTPDLVGRRPIPRGRGGPLGAGPGAGPRSVLGIAPGRILNDAVIYLAIVAAALARHYFVRYRARQAEAIRLQAESAQLQAALANARLAALRAQVNPHFLFNTLHAVSSLVEHDPPGVRRMIARLSELLRLTLDESAPEEVALDQELAYLAKYLEIMQIRFGDKLHVDIDVDADVRAARVPQLILQPIVENAVKHGVAQSEGGGRIEVRGRRIGDRVLLSVRDTGAGPVSSPTADGEGLGLKNTRERLAQLYAEAQSLTLRAAHGGGTIVEITLPFRAGGDAPPSGDTTRQVK